MTITLIVLVILLAGYLLWLAQRGAIGRSRATRVAQTALGSVSGAFSKVPTIVYAFAASWLFLLLTVYHLLPGVWEIWWGHSALFWLSQAVIVVLAIALKWGGKPGKWVAVSASSIIVLAFLTTSWGEYQKKNPKKVETKEVSSYTQEREWKRHTIPIKKVSWSEVFSIPYYHEVSWSAANPGMPISILANRSTKKEEKALSDPTHQDVRIGTNIQEIQFKVPDDYPSEDGVVYLWIRRI